MLEEYKTLKTSKSRISIKKRNKNVLHLCPLVTSVSHCRATIDARCS